MKTRSRTTSPPKKQLSHNLSSKHLQTPLPHPIKPYKRRKHQKELSSLRKQNDYDLIPFIPAVQLSVADMNSSPLALICRLQEQYRHFGAVQLVCPTEWNPPFEFKRPMGSLTTRLQPLHTLKNGKPFEEKKEAYSLCSFRDLAAEFQRGYHMKFQEKGLTTLSTLENEYWRLVEGVDKETQAKYPKRYRVTVEYAADLSADRYGSGFPHTSSTRSRDSYFDYAENSFNLNNLYHSQGSLLGISCQRGQWIGGVTIPWVYIGMMFSSFCWHVEDSGINSINYSHMGDTKVWYVVPGDQKRKFDEYVEQRYGSRGVLEKITYMIDPLQLVKKGIKVYKAYQQPKQFICTFFQAYHCGFSQGFNIGQAVNFVIPESLPLIKQSLLSEKPSLFCYEWLVHENYLREQQKGEPCAFLKQEYKHILEEEKKNLTKVMKKVSDKVVVVEDKVKYTRHLCAKCKKYLFLSFTSCPTCKKDFCLPHSEPCCSHSLILSIRNPKGSRNSYTAHLLPP